VLAIEDTADLVHLCRRIISVAPTTTATGCDDAWHRAPVTVTLMAAAAAGALPVAYTEYRVAGGGWTRGGEVVVPAPSDHSADGVHSIGYRSADTATPANVEAEGTCAVKIDTTAPTPVALADASITQGRRVTLRYRVGDALPSGQALSPAATVTIMVKTRGGTTVKRLLPGLQATNVPCRSTWPCGLPKGAYRFFVYATDLAGNLQAQVGNARPWRDRTGSRR